MFRYSLRIFFVLLLILAPALCFAATPEPLTLTLTDALKLAKERNIRVLVANERVRQAIARVGQSRSVLIPQLKGTVSETRQTRDIRTSGIPISLGEDVVGPFNVYDARLRLTKNLLDHAALERLRAARENKSLSQAELRKAEQDALSLVATLFIEARRAEQSKQVTKALVARDQKRLEIAQTRQQSGLGSVRELKQAQADYAQSLYQDQSAIKAVEETRLDLLAALGFDAQQTVVLAGTDDFPAIDLNLLGGQTTGTIKDQPDISVAQKQFDERKHERSAEKAEYLPKISAFADYGPSGLRPDDANTTYTLGVQASVPIFEGGFRQAKVKEAASKLKESEMVLTDTKLNVHADLLTTVEAVRETQSMVNAKEAQLSVTQQQLDEVQQSFRDGTASDMELLDMKTQFAAAQYQTQEASAAYAISRVALARVLGHVEDLGQLNVPDEGTRK